MRILTHTTRLTETSKQLVMLNIAEYMYCTYSKSSIISFIMDEMKNSTGIKEDHVIHISGCFSAEKICKQCVANGKKDRW